MDVQRDQLQQPFIVHFRQQHFPAPVVEQFLRQADFLRNEFVDLLFHCTPANELVDHHIAFLADTKRAVGGLVFDRWIPPAVEVDYMRRGSKIQACPTGLQRQDEKRWPVLALERLHHGLPFAHWSLPVQDQPGATKNRAQKTLQRGRDLAKLGEDQRFLLPLRQFPANFGQPLELSAVLRFIPTIPSLLRGMIADLLDDRGGEVLLTEMDNERLLRLVALDIHQALEI